MASCTTALHPVCALDLAMLVAIGVCMLVPSLLFLATYLFVAPASSVLHVMIFMLSMIAFLRMFSNDVMRES